MPLALGCFGGVRTSVTRFATATRLDLSDISQAIVTSIRQQDRLCDTPIGLDGREGKPVAAPVKGSIFAMWQAAGSTLQQACSGPGHFGFCEGAAVEVSLRHVHTSTSASTTPVHNSDHWTAPKP